MCKLGHSWRHKSLQLCNYFEIKRDLITLVSLFTRLGTRGLPLILRALHTYHMAENARDAAVDYSSVEERNACDAAQRLVSMLCERLCSAWGSSAVVSAANSIR